MRYQEAKNKLYLARVIGLILTIGGGLFTVISVLKFCYFGFDLGDPISHAIAQPLKNVVAMIYGWTTPYLDAVWRVSALPDMREYASLNNVWFICEYVVLIFGIGRIRAAGGLAGRIAHARRVLEDEQSRESVRYGYTGPSTGMQPQAPVPGGSEGGLKLFHTLYFAPVIVGVVVLIIGKILHLT